MEAGKDFMFLPEYRMKRKDGTVFFSEHSVVPLKNNQGQRIGWVSVVRDITERKQAEEALRASDEKFRIAFVASPDAININRLQDGMYVTINAGFTQIMGYTPEECVGKTSTELNIWDRPEDHQLLVEGLTKCGKVDNREARFRTKNGDIKYGLMSASVVDLNGVKHIISNTHDITERKQAESQRVAALETLRENEQNLQTLFETMSEGVALNEIIYDENGEMVDYRILNVNQAFYSTADYRGTDVIGNVATKLYGMSPEFIKEFWKQHKEKNATANTEMYSPLDNHCFFVTTSPFINDRFVTSFFDITERKQAEMALRISEEKFSKTFLASPDSISLSVMETGKFLEVNENFERVFGYYRAEVIGRTVYDLDLYLNVADREYIAEQVRVKGYVHSFEAPMRRKSGEMLMSQISVETIELNGRQCLIGVVRDITARKQAEEEIQQLNAHLEQRVEERTQELRDAQEKIMRQERLSVLGQITGSVGHELRNPLGVISNALYFLNMIQPDASDKVKEYLDIIQQQVHISDKIVGDLLDFTRVKSVDRAAVSASDLIRQTLERFPAPASVQVTLDIPADLPQAYVDPQQMIQILGNLILNACQSMPNGGELTISSRAQEVMISIAVLDTGSGISAENMKKLFEPLFTTKSKGIGLGLVASKKLIEANSGRIEVQSEAGKGSTFTIWLPIQKSVTDN
jgi:PAS domain S-box-containing protein